MSETAHLDVLESVQLLAQPTVNPPSAHRGAVRDLTDTLIATLRQAGVGAIQFRAPNQLAASIRVTSRRALGPNERLSVYRVGQDDPLPLWEAAIIHDQRSN